MPVFNYTALSLSPNDPNAMRVLIDEYAKLQKTLDYLLNGGLDSKNAREFGGFKVNNDSLMHRSGIVGMSSAGTDPTSVRFWAGGAAPASAPFRVTQGGIMTAIGALIQSATGYPRAEINSSSNLFAVYQSATQFIRMIADQAGQAEIYFQNGSVNGSIGPTPTALSISTPAGVADISISAGQALNLFAQALINFSNWSQLYSTGAGRTLQTELNAKATGSGLNGSVYVATTPGGVANTAITFNNGVRIT